MKKDKNKEEITEKNIEANVDIKEANDYEFIRENIKKRPVNKKRVIRKMLVTAGSAVLFAIIACVTFSLLEPVLDKLVNKGSDNDTTLNKVVLTEDVEEEHDDTELEAVIDDTPFEETPIENLNYDDESVGNQGEEPVSDDAVSANTISANMTYVTEEKDLELDDYQMLHRKLYLLSQEVGKSLVVVTSISTDMDILNDPYLSTHSTTGLIIAENSTSIFVLAADEKVSDAEDVEISFKTGSSTKAAIKGHDEETGLVILEVKKRSIDPEVRDKYTIATLGNSKAGIVLGGSVMAVGDPLDVGESICYGAVTSNVIRKECVDATYQILTTDIYASKTGSGVIVNTRGQVIGFISEKCKQQGMDNLICAYGISDIKAVMEQYINGTPRVYVGLDITNVTREARETMGIPGSVYVNKVEKDSPAYTSGIMPGDIVVSLNGESISGTDDYMKKLYVLEPEQEIKLGIMRLNGGRYEEMTIELAVTEK